MPPNQMPLVTVGSRRRSARRPVKRDANDGIGLSAASTGAAGIACALAGVTVKRMVKRTVKSVKERKDEASGHAARGTDCDGHISTVAESE